MTWAEKELERLSEIERQDWTEADCEAYVYIKNVNAESDWLDAQDESEAEMDWQIFLDYLEEIR